jgi:hypothetical protein
MGFLSLHRYYGVPVLTQILWGSCPYTDIMGFLSLHRYYGVPVLSSNDFFIREHSFILVWVLMDSKKNVDIKFSVNEVFLE